MCNIIPLLLCVGHRRQIFLHPANCGAGWVRARTLPRGPWDQELSTTNVCVSIWTDPPSFQPRRERASQITPRRSRARIRELLAVPKGVPGWSKMSTFQMSCTQMINRRRSRNNGHPGGLLAQHLNSSGPHAIQWRI